MSGARIVYSGDAPYVAYSPDGTITPMRTVAEVLDYLGARFTDEPGDTGRFPNETDELFKRLAEGSWTW